MNGAATPDEDPDELPEDQATLEQHKEFLSLLREALEHGAHVAREVFDTYQGPRDNGLFAHLLRWAANGYLAAKGHDLIPFTQEKVNGSGLSFVVDNSHIRSWKAVNDEMSQARTRKVKMFCRQVIQLRLEFPGLDTIGPVVQNLVLLWSPDGKRNLGKMELLKPRTGTYRRGEQYWKWRITVPDIFDTGETSQPSEDEDLDDLGEIGLEEVENSGAAENNPESYEDD